MFQNIRLMIPVLIVVPIKLLVSIWSIAVAVFLNTGVGLFIVGIIPFWHIIFKKFCAFLLFSWSKRLRLKSPTIWCTLFEFFVILKTYFKNFPNDSIWPLGGLYRTLIKLLRFLSNKSSTHRDFTSLQLMLRSSLILKLNTFLIYIETSPPSRLFLISCML